ncbi:MAG: TIM barrel protein [Candidatus Limnocylindrales bacterium]
MGEIARLGFDGCQYGTGFPSGPELRHALDQHGLHLAEVYAAVPCGRDGPAHAALDIGRERLRLLQSGGGGTLVVALTLTSDRLPHSGRAQLKGVPRLTRQGLAKLGRLLDRLGRESVDGGARLCFHQHTATYIETPDELTRLLEATDPAVVGICLDTGHFRVGGGDPIEAIHRWGDRIRHVHLKDVAEEPLARLRQGVLTDFYAALRDRLFTELGNGVLDLDGTLRALLAAGYQGWLMVEQDTTWGPPSESAAISRRVLDYALRIGRVPTLGVTTPRP